MDWLLYIFIGFSAIYFFIILLVILSLLGLKNKKTEKRPFISIVVAAKNEAKRISPALEAFKKINYPQDKYEIIFVDDYSDDATAEVIERSARHFDNWFVLKRKTKSDKYHAKKMALAMGVKKAKGEYIYTTDADCEVHPNWLQTVMAYFEDDTDMVLGFSPLKERNGFLDVLLKFDNLFSAIVVAFPTYFGFPISSVGRNMAFRKSVYNKIGGYEALTKFRSGDDIHLTERMRDNSDGKIVYTAHPESFALSEPPSTGREIFYQQIRKNSKIMDKSLKSVSFSILLLATYLLFFTIPFFNTAWLSVWLGIILLKLIVEYIALSISIKVFQIPKLKPWLFFWEITYPFYVMFFGFLGAMHIYKWK
jgi:cellulose synthase/poly-beta-1,6-N-acetylglucosamine synthase-like glycosyltransferase